MVLTKNDTTTIKGIAICLMLCHHMPIGDSGYCSFTYSMISISKVCVALFLFVSGYGLTKQYKNPQKPYLKNSLKFLLRRYLKFFLHYWFCFTIVAIIGNLCGYTFEDAYPSTRNTLKCFLFDIWGQMEYNSYLKAWWFNKMILQLYLLFPLFYLIVHNKQSALAGLIGVVILQFYSMRIPGNYFLLTEGGIPAFFLGLVMAKHDFLLTPKTTVTRFPGLATVVMLCICTCVILQRQNEGSNEAILLRALLACIIVSIYALSNVGEIKTLSFIGKYATTMYLTHGLLLILIPHVLLIGKYPLLVYILFLTSSMAFAIIIHWLQNLVHFSSIQSFVTKQIERI